VLQKSYWVVIKLPLTDSGLALAAFRKLLLITKPKSTVKIKILKQTRHFVKMAKPTIGKTAFAYVVFCPAGARPLLPGVCLFYVRLVYNSLDLTYFFVRKGVEYFHDTFSVDSANLI
jgi:hypothetical protein